MVHWSVVVSVAWVSAGYSGDVWDEQPPSKDHPWKQMPNQAMTPHTSGTTLDAQVSLTFPPPAPFSLLTFSCLYTIVVTLQGLADCVARLYCIGQLIQT